MTRALLLLIIGILPVHVYGQVAAPESVPEGQAILFELEDDSEGLEAVWTLLNPFDEGVTVTEIRPKGSNSLILDPPCGWSGKIRVQLLLLDAERRIKDIRTIIVVVEAGEGPNPPPIDPNTDETDPKPPEPEPKPAYDGENQYGMGQLAYENTPDDSPYLASFAELMDKAGQHLRGYGGLKVIKATGLRENTNYEVYYWINEQLKNYPKEWQDLYKTCESYRNELGIGVGSPVSLHFQLLQEISAGVRANKKMQ